MESSETPEAAALEKIQEETRYKAGVARHYTGEGLVVHWEPALCIHVASCLRALPQTFDVNARPWIRTGAATADQIAAAIQSCPTGALSYERTDGAQQEASPTPARIEPRRNGPLFLRGNLKILDESGEVVRQATRLALCRCGQSRNKPYCDLSHRAVGFRS